ncbi:GNAT family N-acetyltransferase [Melghirimyces profundicolus]|uniref:GNAT family N-acetyltransferase n=1 Tax=Melghirimyces profundicolus TaxID=1242148 RepID=UPI001FE53D76|nr:GNAT family N-acetyltransferase [Melghirimyces profundicolus]
MSLRIQPVSDQGQLDLVFAIRHEVFVEEQNVPASLEIDEWDQTAVHFLAVQDGQPVGTARLRWVSDDTGKVERVAVLKRLRGTGLGQAIMKSIEEYANKQGAKELKLHAQTHALPFYRKLGYEVQGEPFMDAGIEHIEMKKPIPG